jgi:hypothetical protein|tara:strand:+ start:178 stop:750 length:573 start_codon:yes stop_codon:yes gene_type:complete
VLGKGTVSNWTEVLKKVPAFGMRANEASINQKIEQFQEKQITPFIANLMSNLKMNQLPVFKLRVDNNAANSGPQGDKFVIGRDQIRQLGGDVNRINAKLKQLFIDAKYQVEGSMMGKDMTVGIPRIAMSPTGKIMTDPRRYAAMQGRRGFMGKLRRGGRRINPMTRFKDDRARDFSLDNPNDPRVRGEIN